MPPASFSVDGVALLPSGSLRVTLPLDFARELRANATPEERKLWRVLAGVRPRFTRQYRIGRYVADLACRRARIIVELDGSQHVDSKRDIVRDRAVNGDRWLVLRFWNNEVRSNMEGVVSAIIETLKVRLPPGESVEFVSARPTRTRRRKQEPPPAPPASAGGE